MTDVHCKSRLYTIAELLFALHAVAMIYTRKTHTTLADVYA